MKHKFENDKHNKDGPGQTDSYPVRSILSGQIINDSQNNAKQGFVAWPEKTLPLKNNDEEIEVLEGRTKGGGYVAYPKKKTNLLPTLKSDTNNC
ncbi:MAG: hypothetical protein M3015_06460 [Bacteroidota bacterium]|nr:hypothetical protein [Bacteroidota bacterium]